MAKSASPIRLQAELMQAAESTAKRYHRSTAEQVEYWADLGRSVASELNPDILLSVISGLTVIKTEAVFSAPIDAEAVFQSLESDRENGLLQKSITSNAVRYQASIDHLGYLEQIDSSGSIVIGQFKDGVFEALKDSSS